MIDWTFKKLLQGFLIIIIMLFLLAAGYAMGVCPNHDPGPSGAFLMVFGLIGCLLLCSLSRMEAVG